VTVGLVAAVVVALAWAGLDAARKSLSTAVRPTVLVSWLTLGQVPLLLLWWWLTVPAGPVVDDVAAYLPFAGASAAIGVASNLGFVRAVAVAPLSATIPMLSFVPVASVVIAWVCLDEMPGALALVGVAAVVAGALALGAASPASAEDTDARARRSGQALMGLVAVGWASTVALDKLALGHTSAPVHGTAMALAIGLSTAAWLGVHGRAAELWGVRAIAGRLAGAVTLATVAFGLQLVAVQLVLVATLESVKRAIGIAASVVLGRLLFSEHPSRGQILAVVVMTVGAVMVLVDPLL
jgi:drug/metabolite transporter (DMT)-like permease